MVPVMSQLTLKLTGKTADKLRELVDGKHYQSAEAVVEAALDALDAGADPGLERWLNTVIVERAAAASADPTRLLSAGQVRESLKRNT
jgi:Arc/MetJ-type ribon-helix-helix transcriptional regulator